MPNCDGLSGITCSPTDHLANAVEGWLSGLADSIVEATGSFVASLGTLWVNVPTPLLGIEPQSYQDGHGWRGDGTGVPSAATGPVAFLQEHLLWYVTALAVLSIIVGGARMAWERRAEPGRALLQSLLTLVVVSGAGLAVIALGVAAADGFSVWIIDRSTACEGLGPTETCFGRNVHVMLALSGTHPLGSIVTITAATIALLASLIQIIMMLIRGGMLVLLAGIFPLTAAFTNTEMGKQWFKKCIGWLIAFILYKPAAAIIYATAFQLTGSGVSGASWSGVGEGLLKVLTGITLMCMSLIALPALMRFVAPMTSATAGGAGAGMMAASALGAGAKGAMDVASKMFSSSSSSGGGGGGGGGGGNKDKDASGAGPNAASKSPGGGSTPGAQSTPAAGPGGAGAGGGGAGAGVAGAGAGGGAAAAAGGPVGIAVMAATKVAGAVKKGAEAIASEATEEGGPSGSGK